MHCCSDEYSTDYSTQTIAKTAETTRQARHVHKPQAPNPRVPEMASISKKNIMLQGPRD